jgi:acyl-CoA thioesterase-1
MAPAREPDPVDEIARAVNGAGRPTQLERHLYVLQSGERRNQLERLEHESDFFTSESSPLVLIQCSEIGVVEEHRAACRCIKSREKSEQSGLAAPRGSDDCDEGALSNRERHVAEHGELLLAAHVFFCYFTGNQHERNRVWVGIGAGMTSTTRRLRESAERGLFVATLCVVSACGPGGNGDTSRNAGEAKNNMSVVKGGADSTGSASMPSTSVRTPVVLFFGTSLTAGYGLDPEQAFPALIEKRAEAEGLPIKAVNGGLSGETTAGAARRIDWVLRTPADLVVVEGGANDALRGLAPEAARGNLEQVIATIRKKQPRAKIVLVQMEAPPNYGVTYTRSFRTIYADIARKENVPLLPFLLGGVAGISRLNQADGVHPNVSGERIVADNLWKALKPIIAQLDRTLKSG